MKGLKQWFVPPLPPSGDFRIRGIGVREAMPPCTVNRPQGTGDYLFMMFLEGVRIQVDGEVREFPARSLIAWPPEAGHCYGNPSIRWLHSWMHCEGPFVGREIARVGIEPGRVVTLDDPSILERALLALHEELTTQAEPDPVILRNLFANLLRGLKRAAYSPRAASPIPDRFRRIKAHIESNYTERLTLAGLADLAHLSVAHFCREFRRYFDVSALEFVIRLRMHAAAHHLRNWNYGVTDVAQMVGYEDLFYFSKLFKKRFGLSPRAMRARLQAGGKKAQRRPRPRPHADCRLPPAE